ncbi:MAG: hypothetical protein GY799_03620 [Desulfobulbaceae bacterium]|nr:hypothetical protein [Desulfobulbaceae bacterium]
MMNCEYSLRFSLIKEQDINVYNSLLSQGLATLPWTDKFQICLNSGSLEQFLCDFCAGPNDVITTLPIPWGIVMVPAGGDFLICTARICQGN